MNDHRRLRRFAAIVTILCSLPAPAMPQSRAGGSVDVRLDVAQARATLDLLGARARGEAVEPSRWSRVFESEGYRRALERERGIDEQLGIDRGYSDESFLAWAESAAALDGLAARERTLAAWTLVDIPAAGARAMKYLPPEAGLAATVYPIVRKQSNSFVWDLPSNPAIFMWVGHDIAAEELEMTLVHELHHVGLTGACEESESETDGNLEAARDWLSGFGEGLAVLAAAGGPDRATHAAGQSDLRRAWATRLDSLDTDMRSIETFLLDVAEGRVHGQEARRQGMAFVSAEGVPQGAFYSLGWFMGATVERHFGRQRVVAATCDHGRLLVDYQRAASSAGGGHAGEGLPLWSDRLLEVLKLTSSDSS